MYSNCLIEAIRAKLKDPKNIQIISIDKRVSRGGRHFMWIDRKNQTVHHAGWKSEKHNRFWYDYKINTMSMLDFHRFLVERAFRIFEGNNPAAQRFLEKWKVPLIDWDGATCFQGICHDDTDEFFNSVPSKEDYERLTEFFDAELPIKAIEEIEGKLTIRYITLEELLKLPDGARYRYVTPFDSDFKSLKIWEIGRWFRRFAGH